MSDPNYVEQYWKNRAIDEHEPDLTVAALIPGWVERSIRRDERSKCAAIARSMFTEPADRSCGELIAQAIESGK